MVYYTTDATDLYENYSELCSYHALFPIFFPLLVVQPLEERWDQI